MGVRVGLELEMKERSKGTTKPLLAILAIIQTSQFQHQFQYNGVLTGHTEWLLGVQLRYLYMQYVLCKNKLVVLTT